MSYNVKKAIFAVLSIGIIGLIVNIPQEFYFVGMCTILGGLVAAADQG